MTGLTAASRYDDSVVNLLRLESDTTPIVRASLYRNLIDLMMQDRASTRGANRTRIFETLSRLHPKVGVDVRRDVALRVAQQRQAQPLDLVLWLWTGDPDVSPAMLPTLRLRPADWQALIPKLPKSALGQLSLRADLPPAIQRALAALGAGGVEISQTTQAELVPEPMRELVPEQMPERAAQAPAAPPATVDPTDALAVFSATPMPGNATDAPPEITDDTPLYVDWAQLRSARTPEANHLDQVARSIFVAPPERVIASNDDVPAALEPQLAIHRGPLGAPLPSPPLSPGVPTQALTDEAQAQIRDLIQRIADFRKRWIDRPPLYPPMSPAARGHTEIADAIQSEMDRAGLAFATPVPTPDPALAGVFDLLPADEIIDRSDADTLPAQQTTADDMALLLTPAVARRLPPLESALPSPADQSAAAALAAVLADWQWEADRAGRFVQARAVGISTGSLTDLLPGLRGTQLLALFTSPAAATVVARALERRSAFRDVEFNQLDGPLSGSWWLSGVAVFDPRTGLYLGHRGIARRAEGAGSGSAPGQAITLPAETLSTMAHETRTPLNAIMGFAQLIDAQTWGAVPAPYAPNASAILQESQKLLQALDDVTDTSRIERGAFGLSITAFDPGELLTALLGQQKETAEAQKLSVMTRVYPGLPMIWTDRDALERALGRLFVVAMSMASPGEALMAAVRALPNDEVCFSISRVMASVVNGATQPGVAAASTTPHAGQAFAMRFVQQLLAALGGRLEETAQRFDVILPAAHHPRAILGDAGALARS